MSSSDDSDCFRAFQIDIFGIKLTQFDLFRLLSYRLRLGNGESYSPNLLTAAGWLKASRKYWLITFRSLRGIFVSPKTKGINLPCCESLR